MALCTFSVKAQGVLNVRINEVLVVNDDNIVDDYGVRESWIELFNTGYENVDLGGCFIGIRYADKYGPDGNKEIKKYYIPKNDPGTKMAPLSYVLFFCEGTDTKGTFYTNFTLNESKVDMVILYNANGKDVISAFKFPADFEPVADVSWGLIGHDEPESYIFPTFSRKEKRAWKDQGITLEGDFYLDQLSARLKYQPQVMARTTPRATNETMAETPRHEIFRRSDPVGIVMALSAMGVVFAALILIFLVIKLFGKIMVARTNRKEAKEKGQPVVENRTKNVSYSGEEVAAIAMALKMYQEDLHVKESTVITINRVGRVYSPWSSKIHSIRQMPERKK